ncbi:MAG: hypothetical protein LBG65_07605 [Puniceicoccales bacterium]|jgi:hypothetical protein|nr:hypothetical protein [Puniceicoccales bacterium]
MDSKPFDTSRNLSKYPLLRYGGNNNARGPSGLLRAYRSHRLYALGIPHFTFTSNTYRYDENSDLWHMDASWAASFMGLVSGERYRFYMLLKRVEPMKSAPGKRLPSEMQEDNFHWDGRTWPPPDLHFVEFVATARAGTLYSEPPESPMYDDSGDAHSDSLWDIRPNDNGFRKDSYCQPADGECHFGGDPLSGWLRYPCVEFARYWGPNGGYEGPVREAIGHELPPENFLPSVAY